MDSNKLDFEEFCSRLRNLDWYYMMADDGYSYHRGRNDIAHYRSIAQKNGPEWVEAFEAMEKSNGNILTDSGVIIPERREHYTGTCRVVLDLCDDIPF